MNKEEFVVKTGKLPGHIFTVPGLPILNEGGSVKLDVGEVYIAHKDYMTDCGIKINAGQSVKATFKNKRGVYCKKMTD